MAKSVVASPERVMSKTRTTAHNHPQLLSQLSNKWKKYRQTGQQVLTMFPTMSLHTDFQSHLRVAFFGPPLPFVVPGAGNAHVDLANVLRLLFFWLACVGGISRLPPHLSAPGVAFPCRCGVHARVVARWRFHSTIHWP